MSATYPVIEYRVNGGEWRHGRSLEAWCADDPYVLREQRRVVCGFVRDWGDAGDGDRVQTRVRMVAAS